eukprot:scaffold324540_cov75-Tisochrysis_lutea.AAC.2
MYARTQPATCCAYVMGGAAAASAPLHPPLSLLACCRGGKTKGGDTGGPGPLSPPLALALAPPLEPRRPPPPRARCWSRD